jgi:hypothetical protein
LGGWMLWFVMHVWRGIVVLARGSACSWRGWGGGRLGRVGGGEGRRLGACGDRWGRVWDKALGVIWVRWSLTLNAPNKQAPTQSPDPQTPRKRPRACLSPPHARRRLPPKGPASTPRPPKGQPALPGPPKAQNSQAQHSQAPKGPQNPSGRPSVGGQASCQSPSAGQGSQTLGWGASGAPVGRCRLRPATPPTSKAPPNPTS